MIFVRKEANRAAFSISKPMKPPAPQTVYPQANPIKYYFSINKSCRGHSIRNHFPNYHHHRVEKAS